MLYDGKKYQARMEKISNKKKPREVENKFCNPFSGVMERSEHSEERESFRSGKKSFYSVRCRNFCCMFCAVHSHLLYGVAFAAANAISNKDSNSLRTRVLLRLMFSNISETLFALRSIIMTTHVVLPFISENLFFSALAVLLIGRQLFRGRWRGSSSGR